MWMVRIVKCRRQRWTRHISTRKTFNAISEGNLLINGHFEGGTGARRINIKMAHTK
jgi:hypothetical protein